MKFLGDAVRGKTAPWLDQLKSLCLNRLMHNGEKLEAPKLVESKLIESNTGNAMPVQTDLFWYHGAFKLYLAEHALLHM